VNAQKRLLVNFRLKFWHHHSIPWPRFPYRARYFGDLRTFSVDFFAFHKLNVRHISTSGLVDLESVSRDAYLVMKFCTKFEVDTTIRCLVIALLLLIRYVTLWPWPFDFGQWSYMAGHVVNPSTNFEDLVAIRSWVMCSDVSHLVGNFGISVGLLSFFFRKYSSRCMRLNES